MGKAENSPPEKQACRSRMSCITVTHTMSPAGEAARKILRLGIFTEASEVRLSIREVLPTVITSPGYTAFPSAGTLFPFTLVPDLDSVSFTIQPDSRRIKTA